ncbi:MAG: hypothetical protein AAFP69_12310, partial [Planctomycetota bacterium]
MKRIAVPLIAGGAIGLFGLLAWMSARTEFISSDDPGLSLSGDLSDDPQPIPFPAAEEDSADYLRPMGDARGATRLVNYDGSLDPIPATPGFPGTTSHDGAATPVGMQPNDSQPHAAAVVAQTSGNFAMPTGGESSGVALADASSPDNPIDAPASSGNSLRGAAFPPLGLSTPAPNGSGGVPELDPPSLSDLPSQAPALPPLGDPAASLQNPVPDAAESMSNVAPIGRSPSTTGSTAAPRNAPTNYSRDNNYGVQIPSAPGFGAGGESAVAVGQPGLTAAAAPLMAPPLGAAPTSTTNNPGVLGEVQPSPGASALPPSVAGPASMAGGNPYAAPGTSAAPPQDSNLADNTSGFGVSPSPIGSGFLSGTSTPAPRFSAPPSTSSSFAGAPAAAVPPPGTSVSNVAPSNVMPSNVATPAARIASRDILSMPSLRDVRNLPGDPRFEGVQTPAVVIHKQAPREVKVGRAATFVI